MPTSGDDVDSIGDGTPIAQHSTTEIRTESTTSPRRFPTALIDHSVGAALILTDPATCEHRIATMDADCVNRVAIGLLPTRVGETDRALDERRTVLVTDHHHTTAETVVRPDVAVTERR